MTTLPQLRLYTSILCLFVTTILNAQDAHYQQWKLNFEAGIKAFEDANFELAQSELQQAKIIAKSFSETYLQEKGNTFYSLGKVYATLQNEQAFTVLEQALKLSEALSGKLTLNYVEKATYVGFLYETNGDYKNALQHYNDALLALDANEKSADLGYAARLSLIGEIYIILDDFITAESIFNQSLHIIEQTADQSHLDYGTTLSSLSIVYKKKGEYKAAIATAKQALKTIKHASGDKSPEYALGVTNLTQIYSETGAYDAAITMQKKVIVLYESLSNTSKDYIINYAGAIFTLANLYHDVEEYEKEILLLNQVQEILDESHYGQVAAHNNLGQAYDKLGNYEKALLHTQKAIHQTEHDHSSYGIRLQNLAYIYVKLGAFEKAIETYTLAREAMVLKFGKDHSKYGQLLNNIGKLQFQLGHFLEAKQLFSDALDNFLKNFDENHPDYGYFLNDYAKTLLQLGQSEEALKLMQKNISIAEKNSRLNTEAYFNRQYNLAQAYNLLGRYNEALPLLQNATENLKLKLGTDHPDYGKMLMSLSDSYIGLGHYDKAFPIMEKTNDVTIQQLDKIFKFRSEVEKKAFLSTVIKNFDAMQSIPIETSNSIASWNALNLNNQLMLKGLLLNNSKTVLNQLKDLNDTSIQSEIDTYNILKRQLAKVLSQPIIERETDVDSLKAVVNNKETQLVKLYSTYFGNDFNLVKNWKLAQSKLQKDEIAVEFSHFRYTNQNKVTDSILYVAYLYKYDWEFPEMVPLFEQKELNSILKNSTPNTLYNSQRLYDLVWQPIEKMVGETKTVYFSPSGLLNQIQFAAVSKVNSLSVGQQYHLVQLSSTALLAEETTEPSLDHTLFIGGIAYDYSEIQSLPTDLDNYAYLDNDILKNSNATRSRGESWTYLKGTLKEITDLQTIFETHDKSYSVLSSKEATETSIKKLSGDSPSVLHIATHGFFYENLKSKHANTFNLSTEDQYRLAEDPLLRSGILLAGANYAWKHGSNPYEPDDGILSAMEISNLDLSNTDMIVLSACETGLGDIDGSEGVYGLQRAFKMAGVDIIVMSLWQVPDAETAEFMNTFYRNWMVNNEVRQAFIKTQRMMQKTYPNEPLKWAAFVLFQ